MPSTRMKDLAQRYARPWLTEDMAEFVYHGVFQPKGTTRAIFGFACRGFGDTDCGYVQPAESNHGDGVRLLHKEAHARFHRSRLPVIYLMDPDPDPCEE